MESNEISTAGACVTFSVRHVILPNYKWYAARFGSFILLPFFVRLLWGPRHRGPPQPNYCGGPDPGTPTGSTPMFCCVNYISGFNIK